MHEILTELRAGTFVLDLGCARGSFSPDAAAATIVRVDRDRPPTLPRGTDFVQADATCLPFADQTFAAVISNHSLEHFDDLEGALREIRRVMDPDGSLYVAVPDASTLTDKLYRWLAAGGGHVNAFTAERAVAATIAQAVGLRHVATRPLYSSLSFLNRRNAPGPIPRRLHLLGGGSEWSLFVYAWLSRRVDRMFRLRTSIYGWAFYFGRIAETIDVTGWVNVCIRCGSGHASGDLRQRGLRKPGMPGIPVWRCPACGASNPFMDDPV